MQIDSDPLLCRQIVERAQDAVIFSDREGLIRLWNAGAERTFGYLTEEALGRTLDMIAPSN
jgi:PAS domain S-box-containing protein